MNLQLNQPWLTDKTPTGGCCAAATPAELLRKPDTGTAGSAAQAARGNHSHLELTLGMPSSSSSYPSPPPYHHHNNSNNGDAKGRSTATSAHGRAAAPLLFTAHGAAAEKPSPAGARAAPTLLYQMPGSSSSPCGQGTKRWFSQTAPAAAAAAAGVGFVHPWSLAARQEKAALEQAARAMVVVAAAANQPQPAPSPTLLAAAASRPTQPPPPVVGWPPIRTYRKNAITNPPRMQKPAVEDGDDDDEKEPKKSKPCQEDDEEEGRQASEEDQKTTPTTPPAKKKPPPTMFVKVNMEGFAVGRKIDLLAHDGYGSLSCALHKMFDNFLSVKNAKMDKDSQSGAAATSPELVLLYEDNEGDRMLVGDVPWEMFVGSVKRLYISITPKMHGSAVGEEYEKTQKETEATVLT